MLACDCSVRADSVQEGPTAVHSGAAGVGYAGRGPFQPCTRGGRVHNNGQNEPSHHPSRLPTCAHLRERLCHGSTCIYQGIRPDYHTGHSWLR